MRKIKTGIANVIIITSAYEAREATLAIKSILFSSDSDNFIFHSHPSKGTGAQESGSICGSVIATIRMHKPKIGTRNRDNTTPNKKLTLVTSKNHLNAANKSLRTSSVSKFLNMICPELFLQCVGHG